MLGHHIERQRLQDYIQKRCYAITGSIASGKSTLRSLLQDQGYYAVDADKLSHQLLQPGALGWAGVRRIFGEQYFDKQGELNRCALRQRIFTDTAAKAQLEELMHPLIYEQFLISVQNHLQYSESIMFYEAALIFEKKQHHRFRGVILTVCDDYKQRIQERSGITWHDAQKILSAQMPDHIKSQKASLVLNTSSLSPQQCLDCTLKFIAA